MPISRTPAPPKPRVRPARTLPGRQVSKCGARQYPKLLVADGRPIGQIGYVGTEEAHRGRGLATLMTAMCLKRLFRTGAGEVLISTGLDNPAALRAYEKAGFRRRHYVTEWTKALV